MAVDLSVVHNETAVFEKAGLSVANQGRPNENIRIEPHFCGIKVFHEWDEEQPRKGSKLAELKEQRHVWTTYFLSPAGELIGKNIAMTDWQPVQGLVELATGGFHV